jgi:EAL and modified HD-GYP domain-containing signal transduction protein
MTVALDPRSSVHIARQPIFDPQRRVFGYELLYRAEAQDRACTTSGDLAASRVLTDAILGIGLPTLTGGARAFVNFTKPLIVNGSALLLPADASVIEVREDVAVDAEVVEACRDLQARGYTLALDDFVPGSAAEALLPYAAIVKLDVLETQPHEWQRTARRFAALGKQVVAERVEANDVVSRATLAGCTLFQGFFFCRPATASVKVVPARRLAYLQLFSALNRPDLTIDTLEDLVKHDVSLSMRVLRSINSAAFALNNEVTSLRHALVLLGVQQVRQWASVWAMAGVNTGGTAEAVSVAILRARSCEALGRAWAGADAAGELFLLGMCSMLPAILDQPMERATADLPLSSVVRAALAGEAGPRRSILDAVIAYEQGEWDTSAETLQTVGVSEFLLATAYAEALQWARQLSADALAA